MVKKLEKNGKSGIIVLRCDSTSVANNAPLLLTSKLTKEKGVAEEKERRKIMKKVLFLRMMAVAIIITLFAGCGAANAAPAKQEPAQAETAEPATQEFPSQSTLVVWLEKGKTLNIEEYTDHFLVASADGTEEFPLSLPHLEEEELLFTELPVEWQEALSN